MQALVLELVALLIKVTGTDSPTTPDKRSLQQRQWEENYIRSHVQEQAQHQP